MSNITQLASVELINQSSVQITFSVNWYEEDIPMLTACVLNLLGDHHVIEKTTGADREYCRFEWQQDYFIINFECYSHSCWIEGETTPNIPLLTAIKQQLEVTK